MPLGIARGRHALPNPIPRLHPINREPAQGIQQHPGTLRQPVRRPNLGPLRHGRPGSHRAHHTTGRIIPHRFPRPSRRPIAPSPQLSNHIPAQPDPPPRMEDRAAPAHHPLHWLSLGRHSGPVTHTTTHSPKAPHQRALQARATVRHPPGRIKRRPRHHTRA